MRTRDVDTVTILEVLDGGTSGGLELYSSLVANLHLPFVEYMPE